MGKRRLNHNDRQELIDQRTLQAAFYYVRTEGATLATTAKVYKVSESTIHKDLNNRLKKLNMNLYRQVRKKTERNKLIKHILGGIANSKRWKRIRREQNKKLGK